MSLLVDAALLAALAVALVGPVSIWLARVAWVARAPRAAVVLWQAIGLSALIAGIGAGLSVAVARYHEGFARGVRDLVTGLVDGRPLHGLGLPDALGLTLAADLLVVLAVVFGSTTVQTVGSRAHHRRLLNLLARRSSDYPGTDLIEDDRPVAYCLPGRRPRIVVSVGALHLLSPSQLRAVIEHERGHAHAHHGLVLLPMEAVRKVFRWIPYARVAPREMACLLEMSADDFSARHNDPGTLASALVHMAESGHVPSCALAVSGDPVRNRVARLLAESRTSKRTALATGLVAGAVLSTPLAAMLLS